MKLCLILLLAIMTCGCKKQESNEQVVRLNFHSEPSSLDPRLSRDLPSLTVCRMLYEGLFRPHESGAQPALAHSFTLSEDKCTYFFEIRRALWSDGTPIVAKDFETAWKSALSPTMAAESVAQLFVIEGAREAKLGKVSLDDVGVWALGPTTLKVKLAHPDPYFFERLCHPVSYPVPSKRIHDTTDWTTVVYNGPFRLIELAHGDHLRLEKNGMYWDRGAVKLNEILITFVEDEHTELNMYENDELDWAGSPNSSVPPEAIPSLKEQRPDELFIQPLASTYCYKFNTKVPPFNNAKIREAFSRAIERETLIDNILQAGQIAACRLIPPSLALPTETICAIKHPSKLFEEGLEEMGWTRETMPPVTLLFSKSEKHQKIAQAVQHQWNHAFGIKVALQSYEWNVFLTKLAKGEYQVGGRGWISELSDPKSFLDLYRYDNDHELSGGNDTGWHDEAFTQLLSQAELATNESERQALIREAEMRLLSSCAIAPVYHSTACYLKKERLQGVQMTQLCDLDFKTAYLESP